MRKGMVLKGRLYTGTSWPASAMCGEGGSLCSDNFVMYPFHCYFISNIVAVTMFQDLELELLTIFLTQFSSKVKLAATRKIMLTVCSTLVNDYG